jgi:hypothetical protein
MRCTIALKDPLRSEPQIETTFKLAMTASKFFEDMIAPGPVPTSCGEVFGC